MRKWWKIRASPFEMSKRKLAVQLYSKSPVWMHVSASHITVLTGNYLSAKTLGYWMTFCFLCGSKTAPDCHILISFDMEFFLFEDVNKKSVERRRWIVFWLYFWWHVLKTWPTIPRPRTQRWRNVCVFFMPSQCKNVKHGNWNTQPGNCPIRTWISFV